MNKTTASNKSFLESLKTASLSNRLEFNQNVFDSANLSNASPSSDERMDLLNENAYRVVPEISNTPSPTVSNMSVNYLNTIELEMLRSSVPIQVDETEEISINGIRGVFVNKKESEFWSGSIPLSEYPLNIDDNPEIINKKVSQELFYIQELAIRYLRPPTPPRPGDIIIKQEKNSAYDPAPPLIIRQQPPRPDSPEPLIIREVPPKQPSIVGKKIIKISGKNNPPPPRKVIIERLPPLPSKPQSILVERWLPYKQSKRRVIYQKSKENSPVILKPRNTVVQWEPPAINIKREVKHLGTIRANPAEYVKRFGSTLKNSNELPQFVLDIKHPENITLAADVRQQALELEGDIDALELIDLDREGLSDYRPYFESYKNSINSIDYIIKSVLSSLSLSKAQNITFSEAKSILSRINERMKRNYNGNDLKELLNKIKWNNQEFINMNNFKKELSILLLWSK